MTEEQHVTRIHIVDDHPIVRQGIAQLINREADLEVCAEAGSAEDALEAIAADPPDMVIIDISLSGISGIELTKTLKKRYPQVRVLVISMHDETLHAERALRAGAKGYIMKQEATDNILTAIRRIKAGDFYLSDAMQARIFNRLADNGEGISSSPVADLSDRELEIFRLIGMGLGTGEIARKLNRSVKTVEAHRANIKDKLDIRSAPELVRFAVQWVENEA